MEDRLLQLDFLQYIRNINRGDILLVTMLEHLAVLDTIYS